MTDTYTFPQSGSTTYLDANTANTTGSCIRCASDFAQQGFSISSVDVVCKATGSGTPQSIRAVIWSNPTDGSTPVQVATGSWSSPVTGGDQTINSNFSPAHVLADNEGIGFEGDNPSNSQYQELKCNTSDEVTGTSTLRIYTGDWQDRTEGNLWITLNGTSPSPTSSGTRLPPSPIVVNF